MKVDLERRVAEEEEKEKLHAKNRSNEKRARRAAILNFWGKKKVHLCG